MRPFFGIFVRNGFYFLKPYRKQLRLTWCNFTTSPVGGGWASERRSTSVSGRRVVRAARLLFRGQSRSRINELSSSDSTWVKDAATLGLFTLRTWTRMMEGGNRLVFTVTSWQRRGLRGNARRDFRRTLWLDIFTFSFIYLTFFELVPLLRVSETQRCLQKCCASPRLWSCTSTLWAQISATMTGTWVPSRHLSLISSPQMSPPHFIWT